MLLLKHRGESIGGEPLSQLATLFYIDRLYRHSSGVPNVTMIRWGGSTLP